MTKTIKSETSCPTCGQSVKVGDGDGDSHYYIPNEANPLKAQLAAAKKQNEDQAQKTEDLLLSSVAIEKMLSKRLSEAEKEIEELKFNRDKYKVTVLPSETEVYVKQRLSQADNLLQYADGFLESLLSAADYIDWTDKCSAYKAGKP